jgi:hypothetical protein
MTKGLLKETYGIIKMFMEGEVTDKIDTILGGEK